MSYEFVSGKDFPYSETESRIMNLQWRRSQGGLDSAAIGGIDREIAELKREYITRLECHLAGISSTL